MKLTTALVTAFSLLATAGSSLAFDVQNQLLTQLRRMGYTDFTVSTTMLGRLQVIATDGIVQREIVVNPRTLEVMRDYSSPVSQSASDATLPPLPPILEMPLTLELPPAPAAEAAASPGDAPAAEAPSLLELVFGKSEPTPEEIAGPPSEVLDGVAGNAQADGPADPGGDPADNAGSEQPDGQGPAEGSPADAQPAGSSTDTGLDSSQSTTGSAGGSDTAGQSGSPSPDAPTAAESSPDTGTSAGDAGTADGTGSQAGPDQ